MPEPSIHDRVEILEQKVAVLETLPARIAAVEMQIVQLREEMRGEFTAVRAEMRAGDEALRAEIRAGDEETRRFMRVLHEDLIARLAIIQEGQPARRKKPKT